MVEVLQKGFLTLPVSSAHHGLERYGVPAGGPMDICRCTLANRLVGNSDTDHVLEATMILPNLRFLDHRAIAIVGGRCNPVLIRNGNELPVPANQTVFVQAGDVLIGGSLQTGFRSYLSVSGGFLCPKQRTTPLNNGDCLQLGTPVNSIKPFIANGFCNMPNNDAILRVTEGVHANQFTRASLSLFHSESYTYTPQSDRMGIRFSGKVLEFLDEYDGNILSEGVIPGDIQVTSAGLPILMMADCQTVGGYTKIAHVISADLPIAAQLRPGAQVRFVLVMIPEAQAAWRKLQYQMETCLAHLP